MVSHIHGCACLDVSQGAESDGGTIEHGLSSTSDFPLFLATARSRIPSAHGGSGAIGYVSATKWVVDLEVMRFQDKAA